MVTIQIVHSRGTQNARERCGKRKNEGKKEREKGEGGREKKDNIKKKTIGRGKRRNVNNLILGIGLDKAPIFSLSMVCLVELVRLKKYTKIKKEYDIQYKFRKGK